jgi:hypothetical protein
MKKALLILVTTLVISGCSINSRNGVNTSDLNNVDFTKDFKSGDACEFRFLIFFGPFGDASVVKAAKSADITKVDLVEYKSTSYIVFGKSCTIVHGE